MTRYITGRVVSGLFTLLLFVTLLFVLVSNFIPGDWTSQWIMSGVAREALQEQLGLDRSIWEQYFDWLCAAFSLDLGQSFSGPPVWDLIRESLPSTLLVLIIGSGAAFVFGAWVGRMEAYTNNRLLSGTSTFLAAGVVLTNLEAGQDDGWPTIGVDDLSPDTGHRPGYG